jgi:predicted nuclease of restriction endonuclease-like (RecB) superfamily
MKSDEKNPAQNIPEAFNEVIAIIENARENAFRAVNRELINMYWDLGEYVHRRAADGGWGKSVVKDFAEFIQGRYVGIKGFSPQNIWRMKQFYETYRGNEKLSALLRELSWTNNILIMACKTDEEREFYLRLSVKNCYSSRELERQIDSALYERTMMSDIRLRITSYICPTRRCWKTNSANWRNLPGQMGWRMKTEEGVRDEI